MAALMPAATPRAQLIMGGAQPADYDYVGLNQGLSVWAHADIVTASVTDVGEEGSCPLTAMSSPARPP